jgi:transaldolase
MSALDDIRKMTVVVADTGDIESIRSHRPRDATTNPSLLLAAAQMPEYASLVARAIERTGPCKDDSKSDLTPCLEMLAVGFGLEILKIIPGRVSVEVDARLSFDTEGTLQAARRIAELFRAEGVGPERFLVKEGIRKFAADLQKLSKHLGP